MSIPRKKICAALAGVLCAAALICPARTGRNVACAASLESVTLAESSSDDGALFYEYLLRRVGVSDRLSLLADARSKLDEKDQYLYDQLKTMIAEVADGVRTSSVFDIKVENFQTEWTAEELGVSSIIEGDNIAEEASDALLARMEDYCATSPESVVNALLADCPYELYWFDKTGAQSFGARGAVGANNYGGEWVITADATLTYSFTFLVSENYGSGATVDRSLHDGIEKIVSNAAAIVNAYRNQSDYEKLLGYSTEICKLADYDAAAQNPDTPYGDPWQIISVFDDDPETNVVCEGYAKAFKYLCDLSEFDSPKVECCLVSGLLGAGTGAGPHMWNVVTMDNGKRYLVDVTNSDSNGGPDFLFLKGGVPDSQTPFQYTFYGQFPFTYDDESISLWGSDFLRLDTEDYQPSAPAYAYQIRNVAPDGANVTVTVEIRNHSGDGASLFVAAYAENGRFLRAATQSVSVAQGASGFVTLPLDTSDAKTVKAFLLDRNTQTPLCPSGEHTTPSPQGG